MINKVLLTRPAGNNDGLVKHLTEAGYGVDVMPVLEIVLADPETLLLPQFAPGDLCIFISANAARAGLPLLAEALVTHHIESLAVGAATAAELNAAQLPVSVPEQADSEGLLSMPVLQDVADKQVVIVKGEGGRGLLAETLGQRGAQVTEFVCYRRQPAALDGETLIGALADPDAAVIQANSGETLEHLSELLETCGQPTLFNVPVVVPSERVARLAKDKGWQWVHAARGAGDDAFIEALTAINEALAQSRASDGEDTMNDKVQPQPDDAETSPTNVKQDESSVASDVPAVIGGNLETSSVTSKAKAPRSDWFARILVLLLLLLIGGAGAAGYMLVWPDIQARDNVLSAVDARLDALEKTSAAAQTGVENTLATRLKTIEANTAAALREQSRRQARELADNGAQQARIQDRLDRIDLRVSRLTATDRRAWLANESAFLVRLASQRLLASRDVAAAEGLLGNADSLLAEAEDPRLAAARRAVAADRAALRAAPRVDSVGVYARFAALIGQAAALQVVAAPGASLAPLPEGATWIERAEAGWQAGLHKLSDYLVVHRRDAEMSRMMTPDWEALARQNLRMLLEQAQIAALSANQGLYETALERATVFTKEFSGTDPDRVASMLDEISALSTLNIAPVLPDLLGSQSALADAIRLLDLEGQPSLPIITSDSLTKPEVDLGDAAAEDAASEAGA